MTRLWQSEVMAFLQNEISHSALDLSRLVPAGELTIEEALQVYRTGYIARLTESLGEIYPGVWRVIGDEAFFNTCAQYIEAHPSQSYNLSLYGEGFVDFISDSWVRSVAILDFNFHQIFHAEGKTPALLRFVELDSKTYSFWVSKDQEQPNTDDIGKPGAQYVLFYKNDVGIFTKKFTKNAFQLLRLLNSGITLESAISELRDDATESDVIQAMEFIAASQAIEVES